MQCLHFRLIGTKFSSEALQILRRRRASSSYLNLRISQIGIRSFSNIFPRDLKKIKTDIFVIKKEEVGERLDKILANRFKNFHSRCYFESLIDEQLVLVNGEPVKKGIKLRKGDEIEVQFVAIPDIQLIPEAIPLPIIYEDEYLLAINKPAGMVVHPGPGNYSGTFVNGLIYHCNELERIKDSLRPGIVHRLDKETSGILVAAKTLETQQKLRDLFASRQIYKEYLAICVGHPSDGEISAPIGRHPIHRQQMTVLSTGKQAKSFLTTLEYNGKLSIVQMVLATGRKHQARVHLKYKENPILGDAVYGNLSLNRVYGVQRQYLHATTIKFQHPITEQPLTLTAPLPDDMSHFIREFFNRSLA